MWKINAKLLAENRSIKPAANKQATKASDLKVGQLVFVKDYQKGTFDPSNVFDHRVAGIVNDSTVILTTTDGKEKRCNIHHIKLTTALEASTSAFKQFRRASRRIWVVYSHVTCITCIQKQFNSKSLSFSLSCRLGK